MSADKPFKKEDVTGFFEQCKKMELENRELLLEFQDDYPGVLNGDNLSDILKMARRKTLC